MAEKLKSAEVGGRQAGYLFEFKSDGVYLTVYPADDSGIAFELSDMRQILKEYGVIDYDMAELARAIRAAEGTPVLLAKQYEAALPFIEDRRLALWTHNKAIQKACESRRVSAVHKKHLRTLKIKTF